MRSQFNLDELPKLVVDESYSDKINLLLNGWIRRIRNYFNFLDVCYAKGDLAGYNGYNYERLPVGTDTWSLVADSTTSTGLKWALVGGGGGSLVSPLTTKGDIWGWDTTNNRIPVGADTYVLTADSTQSLGVKWAAGLTSPLTTKGDLWGWSTTNARLPVGADGYILMADSTKALGVKWTTTAGLSTFDWGKYIAGRNNWILG